MNKRSWFLILFIIIILALIFIYNSFSKPSFSPDEQVCECTNVQTGQTFSVAALQTPPEAVPLFGLIDYCPVQNLDGDEIQCVLQ